MAGVVLLVAEIRQVRRGDLQHIGAVLGERACARGPGEHAREIEHADPCQRTVAVGQLLRRAVADLDDLHQRQRRDRGGVRVFGPLVHRANHAAGTVGGDDRLLECKRVPLRDGATHRLAILGHAEHAERCGAMVRKITMQIAPPAVLRRVDAHHRIALGRHGRPIHLHVVPAAQRCRGLAGIDRDLLRTPGAQRPQVRDGKTDGGERGGTALADAKRRGQDRIGATGDVERAEAFVAPSGDRKDRAQRVHGGLHYIRAARGGAQVGGRRNHAMSAASPSASMPAASTVPTTTSVRTV